MIVRDYMKNRGPEEYNKKARSLKIPSSIGFLILMGNLLQHTNTHVCTVNY